MDDFAINKLADKSNLFLLNCRVQLFRTTKTEWATFCTITQKSLFDKAFSFFFRGTPLFHYFPIFIKNVFLIMVKLPVDDELNAENYSYGNSGSYHRIHLT